VGSGKRDWGRFSRDSPASRSTALALGIAGSGSGDRRKAVAAQLPVQTWPEKALVIGGVNAETGERRAFDRNTGVELVDAVMATTAFWGWPPAFFEGYHYIDGGFYSSDNADVASGFDQVLILALRPPVPSLCVASLDEAVESLRAGGAQVEVVHPDEDCLRSVRLRWGADESSRSRASREGGTRTGSAAGRGRAVVTLESAGKDDALTLSWAIFRTTRDQRPRIA
jgi:NTE family protein